MVMRRNPRLPDHLRDEKTAIEWWLKTEEAYQTEVPLPRGLDYEGLVALSEENLNLAEDEDYDRFEQIVKAIYVLERTDLYVDFMLGAEEKDAVELYRDITVKSLEGIRTEGVGVFWSYDFNCAEAHWGNYSTGFTPVTLTGEVRPEHIDWEGGYSSFIEFGEEECEVRVDPGAPILITAIDGAELDDPIEATA